MKVSTAEKKDRQNYFKVEKVDVDFAKIQIKVKKSNHKLLFSILKPIMLKVIRAPLQKAVEKAIKDQCNKLDQLCYQVKQEAERATAEAKNNPENAPNIYNRYYTAAQKQFTQKKQKAQEVASDKKANIAMTKEDSIFPNIDLPGGISTKATEYKELARKGDKWESPIFLVGSAKKSTDIPAAPKIQRKAHPVSNLGPKETNADYDFYPAGNGHQHTGNGAMNGNGYHVGHGDGLNGGVHSKHLPGNGVNNGQVPMAGQTTNIV
ncbi:hypothetical protein SNK04_003018 [Fusarium graminearum]